MPFGGFIIDILINKLYRKPADYTRTAFEVYVRHIRLTPSTNSLIVNCRGIRDLNVGESATIGQCENDQTIFVVFT